MTDSVDDGSVDARSERAFAETEKLRAERYELLAEAEKLHMDRALAPIIAFGGLVVGALGLLAAFARHATCVAWLGTWALCVTTVMIA